MTVPPAPLTEVQRERVVEDLTGVDPLDRRRTVLRRRNGGVSLYRPPAPGACWVTTVRQDGSSSTTCTCEECAR